MIYYQLTIVDIKIEKLEFEAILCMVTETLSKHLMEAWYQLLLNEKYSATLGTTILGDQSSISMIRVSINELFSAQISINSRTGYVSFILLDKLSSVTAPEGILRNCINLLENNLNADHNAIVEVLKNLQLAV